MALDTLAALSRDVIITVVPFLQGFHGRVGSYGDYWRYSPLALEKSFRARGFETLYWSWNQDHPIMSVYLIHIASKYPERHLDRMPASRELKVNHSGPGVTLTHFLWGEPGKRNWARSLGVALGCHFTQPVAHEFEQDEVR